jgi:transcriptional regulator with XRE-family HTH domain
MNESLKSVKRRLATPKGMTQKAWWEQVSKATGVPVGTLKKIYDGDTTDPRISTLTALANHLLADESVA